MGDISLTSGMRNNLLSLQTTAKYTNQTQDRLSTGKKVNTPLDNPTSYFTAQANMDRSKDFAVRKDGMSESVQMMRTADAGIKAIQALMESAKGIATVASGSNVPTERSAYAATFQTLLSQINMMASDATYGGNNFLVGNSQIVQFGERTNQSTLVISGFNATATGLTLHSATANVWSGVSYAIATNSSALQLESAMTFLRAKSANLSASLSVVTARQDFTDTMINELTKGADNLTLADMNEEGANMLMLQTRQNLGIQSLSMASQAAQAVLRLF